ncbi:MAG: site-specific integrase [Pirellulaceae bacterium]
MQYLSDERNASALTIKAYREDLFGLLEFLEDQRGGTPQPGDLSPQDLRGYQAALQEAEYARTTISRKLASLRSFYRFCQRQELATTNPASPLRNPRRQRKLPHVLSTAEVNRILKTPPLDDPFGLRDRAHPRNDLQRPACGSVNSSGSTIPISTSISR